MRISDWSSDVCSSDLHEIEIDGLAAAILTGHLGLSGRLTLGDGRRGHAEAQRKHAGGEEVLQRQRHRGESLLSTGRWHGCATRQPPDLNRPWRDRTSEGSGKSVSVRVAHGGSRIIK